MIFPHHPTNKCKVNREEGKNEHKTCIVGNVLWYKRNKTLKSVLLTGKLQGGTANSAPHRVVGYFVVDYDFVKCVSVNVQGKRIV